MCEKSEKKELFLRPPRFSECPHFLIKEGKHFEKILPFNLFFPPCLFSDDFNQL